MKTAKPRHRIDAFPSHTQFIAAFFSNPEDKNRHRDMLSGDDAFQKSREEERT
jgi:hypothetical protein